MFFLAIFLGCFGGLLILSALSRLSVLAGIPPRPPSSRLSRPQSQHRHHEPALRDSRLRGHPETDISQRASRYKGTTGELRLSDSSTVVNRSLSPRPVLRAYLL
ncbi:hypothetical protein B0T09DRAFT_133001 [Sordaria sp. MPI-SDFR-AT-0083]|nr:hypothetical protein B0T09DRAFT_133001 [Sordaria sp. MPI-SDFR-AT-0083]